MQENKREYSAPELSVENLSLALYEANRDLTRVNAQLKESERSRQELLANLSHDLRSPVATIKNYAEYLLSFSDLDAEESASALRQIQAKVSYLEYLIEQMLSISTLDAADEAPLNGKRISVRLFLENFFRSCEADPGYQDCSLSLHIPGTFPYRADIDENLLRRVLENLFSNALKYSRPPCSISLSARHESGEVVVLVSDNGIGIDEENLPRIFERTYMVSGARTPEKTTGCGLGLSISESIIHKHGGQIWCESEPGTGSRFFFTLPADAG